jgi:hypothetical protein
MEYEVEACLHAMDIVLIVAILTQKALMAQVEEPYIIRGIILTVITQIVQTTVAIIITIPQAQEAVTAQAVVQAIVVEAVA